MKRIFSIILMSVLLLSAWSCQDVIDVEDAINFPPSIVRSTPANAGGVVIGNFDVKVVFADGVRSPLKSATLRLKDADGNEIFNVTKALSGTRDSVVVAGSSFSAGSLGVGNYALHVTATDTDDQSLATVISFRIMNSLYASNNDEMYIAGEFNGWGWDVLELVADNIWEIKNIDLAGGAWKFKNTKDWSDQDWGDADCDGVMQITSGGGPDTKCGHSGLVNIRFNDQTLEYTIVSAVTFSSRLSGLYLLGTFNSFQGPQPKFTLVANNVWEIAEFRLKAGDAFKFSEGPNFQGKNYGDAQFDGKAEEYGPNIVLPQDFVDAFYKIRFNDANRNYSFEIVRYPYPDNLYLVGGSTSAEWEPSNSIPFVKLSEGKFEIYTYLTVDGGGFKFLQVKDWAGDWGRSKTEEGKIVQDGEENATITTDGFYRIIVDFTNFTYDVQLMNWGIIGSATPGGWGNDTDMSFVGGKGSYKWTIDVTLTTGEIKFRANDSWDVNLGGGNGTLQYNGSNVNVTAGHYRVELILDPVNGYTYTITPL